MMSGGGGNGGGGNGGGDAERWLMTAQKLLLSGDLNGSKTYAIRACEADHSLVDPAELILAVADTLIAGESRIRSDLPDWYAVLRLVRLTHNPELVATQYSRLAVLLNPSRNRFPYSDQAFRLISDAWYVLSDPSRKALYDREVHLSQFGQLGQLGFQLLNQSPNQHEESQNQTVSYQEQQSQNQQLPFQLHQQQQQHSHFAQPQVMQSQPLQQQFGQEQGEMMRSGGSSSSSGRDWRLPVEEERSINLNAATERVQPQPQPSRRFHDQEQRSSSGSRSYEEASSQRAPPPPPSTDLTWSSKTTTPTSEPIGLQSSGQFQPPRSNQAAQLSLLSLVSDQPSQPNRSNQTHSVSKPHPVSKLFPPSSSNPLAGTGLREAPRPFAAKPFSGGGSQSSSQKSKPFATSQPPTTTSKPSAVPQRSLNSKPFPVSEPPQRSSNPFPVSQPTPNSKASPVSQQPPQTSSNPFRVSQQPPTSRPVPVSQPQPQPPPASSSSNPFLVSQQPSTSKPMPVTQTPHHAFQSASHSHPPESSGGPSQLPPLFNSTQSFQQQPVSTTPPPAPAPSTNPSPPQPTGVTNQTQHTETEQTPPSSDSNQKVASFWTTCPYCFVLFEYPNMYEESVLKCQTKSCRRAFQAVKVPSPPPAAAEEEDSYYCCWGFYPIGFTETAKIPPVHDLPRGFTVHDLYNRSGFTEAARIPVYDIPRPAPKKASRKVYYNEDEDDDEYIDSDPSEDEDDDDDDDDWRMSGTKRRKNAKQSKQKASTKPRLGKPRKVIVVD